MLVFHDPSHPDQIAVGKATQKEEGPRAGKGNPDGSRLAVFKHCAWALVHQDPSASFRRC